MPVERLCDDLRAAQLLLEAQTFGDVSGPGLPSWAQSVLASEKDRLEGDGFDVEPSTPWSFNPDDYDAEMFPCPWDFNEVDWVDTELIMEHARIGGGPGYIDSLSVRDPQAMLVALGDGGETLCHYQPLAHAYPLF